MVSGPEPLLATRAVRDLLKRLEHEAPNAEVSRVDAGGLDGPRLAEVCGASLFSQVRVAVLLDLQNLPADLTDSVAALVAQPVDDLALILVHAGGAKGKALLDKAKKGAASVIDCPAVKAWELPQFVVAEARREGAMVDLATAQFLVEAVGHDLQSLAAAVRQLLSDAEEARITPEQVRQYFGGRSEVTSFAVTDATLAGERSTALEQLRWAMSTGVAPVLVTSAMAAGLRGLGRLMSSRGGPDDYALAREVGVPPWKLKSMRSQARGWTQRGVASALTAVAKADGEVKGVADDADFALEKLVLAVLAARGAR